MAVLPMQGSGHIVQPVCSDSLFCTFVSHFPAAKKSCYLSDLHSFWAHYPGCRFKPRVKEQSLWVLLPSPLFAGAGPLAIAQ